MTRSQVSRRLRHRAGPVEDGLLELGAHGVHGFECIVFGRLYPIDLASLTDRCRRSTPALRGLGAAMAIPDQGVNLTGQQIDAGQQADRAVTLVFMIAARAFK